MPQTIFSFKVLEGTLEKMSVPRHTNDTIKQLRKWWSASQATLSSVSAEHKDLVENAVQITDWLGQIQKLLGVTPKTKL